MATRIVLKVSLVFPWIDEFVGEPFTEWYVIHLQAEKGNQDAHADCQQCLWHHLGEMIIFIPDEPGVEDIHHWVVDGIQWIRKVA